MDLKARYCGFIFDADNTLFDFDHCEAEALREALSPILAATPEMIDAYRRINGTLWQQYEKRQTNAENVKVERFRLLLEQVGLRADAEELSSRYLSSLARKHYLMPHAVTILEYLHRRAMLALVTNGLTFVQKSRIARAELEVFFNEVLISEEIGLAKPNAEIFLLAARRLDLRPHDILVVGDSPFSDIQGAHAAGMDACWFSPTPRGYPRECTPPEMVVSDLLDLRAHASPVS